MHLWYDIPLSRLLAYVGCLYTIFIYVQAEIFMYVYAMCAYVNGMPLETN